MLLVRTSFPLERSWRISPRGGAMVAMLKKNLREAMTEIGRKLYGKVTDIIECPYRRCSRVVCTLAGSCDVAKHM